MSHASLTAALDTQLNAISPKPPIAWPNGDYTPTEGTTFLRVSVLPANTATATIAASDEYRGVYEVAVFAASGAYKGAAEAQAVAVATQMAHKTLTYSGFTVYTRAATVGQGIRQGGWYVVPVSISYFGINQ